MTLYARALTLRNCGRFTVIASDFGADYRTHTHVTSEALYASLTRGATWRAGGTVAGQAVYPVVQIKADAYDFEADYDLQALPIWFTPGLFGPEGHRRLPDSDLDAGYFNVVHEFYPTTSSKFEFKKGQLTSARRPAQVPTYGTWQGILPDRQLSTFGLASAPALLETFEVGQTFLLGKKRTMMQIMALSEIVSGEKKQGSCQTGFLQLPPADIGHYLSFDVLAATMRYLILRGETRDDEAYVSFSLQIGHKDVSLALPGFYLARTPLPDW
jgi:hypothetical protein